MADLATEANLLADDSAVVGASKLFFYLWQTAWRYAPKVVAGDADALHDMRVAIRRLRSALQNFEGTKAEPLLNETLRREFLSERKDFAKLGDALGAVRDFDVLDEYLRDYAKTKLNQKIGELPGLSTFERHLQNERADAFAPMVRRVNRAQEAGQLRERVARWTLGLAAATAPQITLSEVAHKVLPVRLEEVAFYSEVLNDSANIEGHHELRKSLKRLRYSLEFFAPCWSSEAKPHIKTITSLQDLLGEMNDRAVLREVASIAFKLHIPDEDEAQSSTRTVAPPEDLLQFLKHGESRKSYLLGRARARWNELQAEGFFEELAKL